MKSLALSTALAKEKKTSADPLNRDKIPPPSSSTNNLQLAYISTQIR